MIFLPTVLLFAVTLVVLSLLSTAFAAPVTPVEDIQALGKTFQVLRTIKGHFDGGEFSADVDAFNGKKH